jgi:hypothetical protein
MGRMTFVMIPDIRVDSFGEVTVFKLPNGEKFEVERDDIIEIERTEERVIFSVPIPEQYTDDIVLGK